MLSPVKFFCRLSLVLCSLTKSNAFIIPHLINLPHIHELNPECAISLVKASTAILPQFDSVGHFVLHANEVLINKVLETTLDPAIKKKLILQIIDMSRQGDEMGGKILSDYYKLIDYLL